MKNIKSNPKSNYKTNFTKAPTKRPDIEFTVIEPTLLLEFLFTAMPDKPKGKVKSILEHKCVMVNGIVRTKYNFPLKGNEKIQVCQNFKPQFNHDIPLEIIYEDDEIIVINKPSGLLSVATDNGIEKTAYRLLTDYVKEKNQDDRVFVVHRLDRDTSGIFMVAKTEKIKFALQEHWGENVSYRGYKALVYGQLDEKEGTIKSWLLETKTHVVFSSETPGDGQEAITNYKVIKQNADYSLVDVNIETGRKNQIRVHMKDLGHCIVGDRKYGAPNNPLRRLGLHAYRLDICHPITKKLYSFKAPTPKKFNLFVK